MAGSRFQQLEDLFDLAVAMPTTQRAAWLATLELEESLHAELRALLAADDAAQPLTDRFDRALSSGSNVGRSRAAAVSLTTWTKQQAISVVCQVAAASSAA